MPGRRRPVQGTSNARVAPRVEGERILTRICFLIVPLQCGDSGFECKVAQFDAPSCPKKRIRLRSFCIDGTAPDRGEGDLELQFQLNEELNYYPGGDVKPGCQEGSSCDLGTLENCFCQVNDNSCFFLEEPEFRDIDTFRSLTVGFEEFDSVGGNDFQFALLSPL